MKKPGKTDESQGDSLYEAIPDARTHMEVFAHGMKLFAQGEYEPARDVFDRASNGPDISVCESARMYLRICGQRIEKLRLASTSPEEQYKIGAKLLAEEKYTESLVHLENALRAGETARVRYALAVATGHMGDPSLAARHFRRACELDPSIRGTAQNDPGFRTLMQFAELREAATGKG
jgi:Tfp pilus assembly protein PilF